MALFAIVFSIVALVLIGAGVALGLVACGLAAVLLGLGVISSSAFVGFRSGRPALAIRALLLQCGLLAGVPAGAVCAWLAQSFVAEYGSGWLVLVYGAVGGACSGLLVAWLLDFSTRRLHAWASGRLLPSTTSPDRAAD